MRAVTFEGTMLAARSKRRAYKVGTMGIERTRKRKGDWTWSSTKQAYEQITQGE